MGDRPGPGRFLDALAATPVVDKGLVLACRTRRRPSPLRCAPAYDAATADADPMLIRSVSQDRSSELAGVAKVHLATRRGAYAHLLPAAALAGMTEASLHRWWEQRMATAPAPHRLLVAVDRHSPDEVLGFAHIGPGEQELGELYALHVHPAAQGRQLGALLLGAAGEALHGLAYQRARLWVLEGNENAQGFYRRHGWCQVQDLRREEDIEGALVCEVAYERDLAGPQSHTASRNAEDPHDALPKRALMSYTFDDDPQRVDLDVVWQFLSEGAYWGRWRTRQDVARQVAAAWRLVGCYEEPAGNMIGFARAVSDGVGLAYLADVFVLPDHRGEGLGRELVDVMIEQGPGCGFRWLLHTADAHDLYAQFGFRQPDSMLLERPHETSRPSEGDAR